MLSFFRNILSVLGVWAFQVVRILAHALEFL